MDVRAAGHRDGARPSGLGLTLPIDCAQSACRQVVNGLGTAVSILICLVALAQAVLAASYWICSMLDIHAA